ncbi:ATP-binding cassette sub-family B member 7, mitochondrial [Lingula anatina]|uniref:Iron-sulfur clusters transporter ABCB7, mitochondrial n=1 Tax=Lingula anatina TaxID=7574 RepID=A0A1S3K485_LINAN|nr:ATP-binding cassette sub-family B member 7, mitochondrial [Lingula anatina]|eukprot:XP_013417448.1 ATP-binding cassette sub-family B member 7, mitochondrial [Lingula anatina]
MAVFRLLQRLDLSRCSKFTPCIDKSKSLHSCNYRRFPQCSFLRPKTFGIGPGYQVLSETKVTGVHRYGHTSDGSDQQRSEAGNKEKKTTLSKNNKKEINHFPDGPDQQKGQIDGKGKLPVDILSGSKEKDVNNWQVLRNLMRFVWPENDPGSRVRVVLTASLLVASKGVTVTVPYIFKCLVDNLNEQTNALNVVGEAADMVFILVVSYTLARVTASVCNELRNCVFSKVSQRSVRQVANKVFHHLHSLDLSFHLGRKTGALLDAVNRGSKGISSILSTLVVNLIPTLFEVTLVTCIMYYKFGGTLALATLGCVGLYVATTLAITTWRTKFRKAMQRADDLSRNRLLDSLTNYETVKYFNNEPYEAKRYDEPLAKSEDSNIKIAYSLALLNGTQNLILNIGIFTGMLIACNGIKEGTMTVGDLVMVNTLLFQLSLPLNLLGSSYREVQQNLIDMQSMFKLLGETSLIKDKPDAVDLVCTPQESEIRFENIHFSYVPGNPILQGLSFTVPSGKRIAIVGGSGSGKSTIIRLLFRFYDPEQGRILVNGQDIRDLKMDSLRKEIGVVPQDTVLFNDSIFYNIRYGNVNKTEEDVYYAAKLAAVHKSIMGMPQQYDTQVGERGLKLSGGEKQRISIARAILKDPPVIVYDEATSSLDSITEQNILQALDNVTKNRTTIVVAHRLSTVVNADEILVLENGRVAERGSHYQLLSYPGSLYAELWSKQHEMALKDANNNNANDSIKTEEDLPS